MPRINFALMNENEREAQIQRAQKHSNLENAQLWVRQPLPSMYSNQPLVIVDAKHAKKSNHSPLLLRKP